MDFYAGLIEDLMDHVLSLVPPSPHSTVIKLTDFRVLLSNELQKITQLDLEIQGPIDFAMIMIIGRCWVKVLIGKRSSKWIKKQAWRNPDLFF